MLHLYLTPEHGQLLFLIFKDLVSLGIVSFGLLVLLEHLLHGQEFSALCHIHVKDKCIDADHLLVQAQRLPPHVDRGVLQSTNDCREKLHVHVPGHEVLLSQLREDLHDLDPAEG